MSTQTQQSQEGDQIAIDLNGIERIDFYVSSRLLGRSAGDGGAKMASFLAFAVPEVIKALSDQFLPGLSPLFHFHREEREGRAIHLLITAYEQAAIPTAHLQHLGGLLGQIAEASIPHAVAMMKMAQGGRRVA